MSVQILKSINISTDPSLMEPSEPHPPLDQRHSIFKEILQKVDSPEGRSISKKDMCYKLYFLLRTMPSSLHLTEIEKVLTVVKKWGLGGRMWEFGDTWMAEDVFVGCPLKIVLAPTGSLGLKLAGSSKDICEFCEKFDYHILPNEADRILLAKLILQAECGHIFITYADKFHITDQGALKELTTALMRSNPTVLLENVEKFPSINQEALKELALSLMRSNPTVLLENVEKFPSINQEALKELALSLTKSNTRVFFENIEKFSFLDHDLRRDIATFLAKDFLFNSYADIFAATIAKFIENEEVRIKIAELFIYQDPKFFIQNWKKFNITNKEAQINLFKLVIKLDSDVFINNFKATEITDKGAFIECATFLAQKITRKDSFSNLKEMALECCTHCFSSVNVFHHLDITFEKGSKNPAERFLQTFVDYIQKETNPEIAKQKCKWIEQFLSKCDKNNISYETLSHHMGLIQSILDMRAPDLEPILN